MTNTTTINGHAVKTYDHKDNRVASHARRLCAALERGHEAIERIGYSTQLVTVWMDADNRRASFEVPDGWRVVRSGVYGGGVAIDLKPKIEA